MKQKKVYLDNNASTPIHPIIRKKFIKALDLYANPSSLHQEGQQARAALERARESIAKNLNCEPDQVFFTSSGCESNNQILFSLLNHHIDRIYYDPCSHASSRYCLKEHPHIHQSALEVNLEGLLNYKTIIKNNTRKGLTLAWGNNETGSLQDINEIIALKREHDICIHLDAVQCIGKVPFDAQKSPIDFLSFASHKLYAPKGAAAIYAKDPSQLKALIHGPSHEKGFRAGTENIASIIAFAEALDLCLKLDFKTCHQLTKTLREALIAHFPRCQILGHTQKTLGNTICVAFPGHSGHQLAMQLDLQGIAVSTGSACSVGAIEASAVLKAMGISTELNLSSIRISLGYFTQEEDLHILIEALKKIIINE